MNKSLAAMLAGASMLLAGSVAYGQSVGGGAYGKGYASPDHGRPGHPGAVRVIRCESHDYRRQSCRFDTRGGVTLVRQLSDQRCVQGRNWGHDRNGVWVANGCRAEFAVGRGGHHRPGQRPLPPMAAGRIVRCESSDHRQHRCNIPVHHGVVLSRQLSQASCVRGRNWGHDRGGIWVARGCRAEFAVH